MEILRMAIKCKEIKFVLIISIFNNYLAAIKIKYILTT